MKNLANCKPSEFLKQTNRIKKSVEKWLTATDIIKIRENMPEFIKPTIEADVEERAGIFAENERRKKAQARKNLSRMLDAILDEHPEETLELLALLCFVEPKDVDEYEMCDYLESVTEMMDNKAVVGFFTSLQRLGLTNTSDV